MAKNDAEAVSFYREVAEQGFAWAQYKLGLLYADGQGVDHSQRHCEEAKPTRQSIRLDRHAASRLAMTSLESTREAVFPTVMAVLVTAIHPLLRL